jgi:hypothetical protein
VLDFCGPFEVFSVTRLDEQRRREESSPFEVQLVAQTADVVSATGGLRVIPDTTIDECPILMEYPFPDDNRRRVPSELVAQASA